MERIASAFEARHGYRVLLSSAATGALYNQIRFGAPFDLFFAADRDSVARLEASGHTGGERGFCYAVGALVLVGGNGELAQLADPGQSLAIANPATAPYGRAAAQVLARPEFAAGSGRKLVRGSNVAQAFQYWHSGSVKLALLPRSLASGTPIPLAWHAPIEQFAVALPRGQTGPAVSAYLDFMNSDTVRHLVIDAGYQPCP
jgi:molybdate transport system substrate-binding protein